MNTRLSVNKTLLPIARWSDQTRVNIYTLPIYAVIKRG